MSEGWPKKYRKGKRKRRRATNIQAWRNPGWKPRFRSQKALFSGFLFSKSE
jgi:hypothetical protein